MDAAGAWSAAAIAFIRKSSEVSGTVTALTGSVTLSILDPWPVADVQEPTRAIAQASLAWIRSVSGTNAVRVLAGVGGGPVAGHHDPEIIHRASRHAAEDISRWSSAGHTARHRAYGRDPARCTQW